MKPIRNMTSVKNVANLFLMLSEPEVGDTISNLKIQKLVYYAQGFHLAMFNKPLFEERILAWEHGPVVEELYHDYKHYGNGSIEIPEEIDITVFDDDQIELIKEVNTVYGQFSAWKLRNMTHDETPWIETPKNQEINHSLMKGYFKTLLNDGEGEE